MFRLKTHSRRAMATSLLVVFLNVFFGQVFCALVMPAAPAHAAEHKHPAGTPAHQHGPKGACCQDDAAAVWASLTHPPKAGIEKMAFMPVALPPAPMAVLFRFQQWDRTRPVLLVARRQLKPKIPDIRIFIQSLTV